MERMTILAKCRGRTRTIVLLEGLSLETGIRQEIRTQPRCRLTFVPKELIPGEVKLLLIGRLGAVSVGYEAKPPGFKSQPRYSLPV